MSDKDIERLQELAKRKLKEVVTKEEALLSLQRAGILDKNGDHTPPYYHLGKFVKSK